MSDGPPRGTGLRRDRDDMDVDDDPRDKGKGPELKIRGQAEAEKRKSQRTEQDEVRRCVIALIVPTHALMCHPTYSDGRSD